MKADYVIIGAGSAGCVLANRLSEDPNVKVLLIEAGGRDWNPYIHVPAGFMKMLDHPTLTWGYHAEPDPGTAGRAILYPRGRVLGGSSSINGLIYIRGQPEDFDHWAQLGNRGWGWDEVLPFFKKAENWEGGETEVRGRGGPLFTSQDGPVAALRRRSSRPARKSVWNIARTSTTCRPAPATASAGVSRRAAAGGGPAPPAPICGRRRSGPTSKSIVKARVNRIVLDGRRAVAVEYERGGMVERADAEREVILSAGAVNSPHILQLSGVGAPEHLNRVGIPVHHALPGVGQNLQDHFIARMSYPVSGATTVNERSRGLALAGEVVRYLVTGKGMLTYSASLAAASVKVLEESATPDVQCSIAPGSFKDGQIGELDDFPGITAGAWQMRPLSRGYVEAKSSDPREAPAINPRYLSEQTDRRAVIGGLRFIRRLFAAPSLAKYVGAEILPGAHVASDDELLDYARQKGSTVYHATCTCKMGSDQMAVVDDQLRVHGLECLRVIDASVMPAVTSTNTNAPTIMIAERGADLIRRAARAAGPAVSARAA